MKAPARLASAANRLTRLARRSSMCHTVAESDRTSKPITDRNLLGEHRYKTRVGCGWQLTGNDRREQKQGAGVVYARSGHAVCRSLHRGGRLPHPLFALGKTGPIRAVAGAWWICPRPLVGFH